MLRKISNISITVTATNNKIHCTVNLIHEDARKKLRPARTKLFTQVKIDSWCDDWNTPSWDTKAHRPRLVEEVGISG